MLAMVYVDHELHEVTLSGIPIDAAYPFIIEQALGAVEWKEFEGGWIVVPTEGWSVDEDWAEEVGTRQQPLF